MVELLAVGTIDSWSVTIDYRVHGLWDSSQPLRFGIYRSDDTQLDTTDLLVDLWTSPPSGEERLEGEPIDDLGLSPTAQGDHRLRIPLTRGLSPDPGRPYVLVTTDPPAGEPPAAADQTLSFRKYTIGVVTHGGIIHRDWKNGPPWQLQTAKILQRQGYDAVIPYSWVSDSHVPGRAAMHGPRLARRIVRVAAQFPPSAPIDLHLIAHSEGAVVNTQAIVALQSIQPRELAAGFVELTLLDPHAANRNLGGQMSTSNGWIGAFADAVVRTYKARAGDPAVFVPQGVDHTEVFYQHTPASRDHGVNGGLYNLWGQVPIPNRSGQPIHYFNLTAAGATHSGHYGVALWYRNFVAPTLGSHKSPVHDLRLEGEIRGAVALPISTTSHVAAQRDRNWGVWNMVHETRPQFSGSAAADSTIRLFVGPAADRSQIVAGGRTRADHDGTWSLLCRPLRAGRYRAVAMAYSRESRTRPGLTIVPMAPLGRFIVAASPGG